MHSGSVWILEATHSSSGCTTKVAGYKIEQISDHIFFSNSRKLEIDKKKKKPKKISVGILYPQISNTHYFVFSNI